MGSPGAVLRGTYRIVDLLDAGGMGEVYLAEQIGLQRQVAIKVCDMSSGGLPQQVDLFESEARILSRLHHPRLPVVHDFFAVGNCYCMVMELIPGTTLEKLQLARHRFTETEVLRWADGLCEVLEYLHSQQPPVIFRDLKPANIMLDATGEVRLIDFGISKLYDLENDGGKTITGARTLGSAGFAAPEQGHQKTDARADIYSLGATLYCLLAGKRPPMALQIGLGVATVEPLSTVRSDISSNTIAAIDRMMLTSVNDRPRSIREVRELFAAPPPVSATEATAPATPIPLSSALQHGQVLQGRYRIERKLGHGGMGTVYLATHLQLKVEVAVKELELDTSETAMQEAIERQFEAEAQILHSLRHPNLPRVTDYFCEGTARYLVMDLVRGQTLAEICGEQAVEESVALAWAASLCDILAYLHTHDPPVIFRDLKPANIMIDNDGHLWLVDFGIAKNASPCNDRTMTFARGSFTPEYAAPEQVAQIGTDCQADIYSLGATLFRLVTGQAPPMSTDIIAGIEQIAVRAVAPRVSERTASAIERMMSVRPEQRPATIVEARAALGLGPLANDATSVLPVEATRPVTTALTMPTRPVTKWQPAVSSQTKTRLQEARPPGAGRPPWAIPALAGVFLLAGALLLIGEFRPQATSSPPPAVAVNPVATKPAIPPDPLIVPGDRIDPVRLGAGLPSLGPTRQMSLLGSQNWYKLADVPIFVQVGETGRVVSVLLCSGGVNPATPWHMTNGVRCGTSVAELESAMGMPLSTRPGSGFTWYIYPGPTGFEVVDGRVVNIQITRAR
ncbi:MAG: protein kinase domain-containing protein [Candidatus Xenobia bacterium]